MPHTKVASIFATLGIKSALDNPGGLAVTSPANGAALASLTTDTPASVDAKILQAASVQGEWSACTRAVRSSLLEAYAQGLRTHRTELAELITLDAGKTRKEALGEVDSSADILLKTIKDASLPEFGGMLRTKERPPLGVVALITSFNFPLVVAQWSIAPALLAGNAVVWKPSEKTPLVAIAAKALFDRIAGSYTGLLQLLVGGREVGQALVADEATAMISATGSVAMGEGIRATLTSAKRPMTRMILELGGNNGVIFTPTMSEAHLDWSLSALMNSFLGTSGQRCTNTRRLIVHRSLYGRVVKSLHEKIELFLATGAVASPLMGEGNEFGYGPLIDEDAFNRFEHAKAQAQKEGGEIRFGRRLLAQEHPGAYYVEPALALMPTQSDIMHHETFAPLLFVVPYEGEIDEAMALLNAPANAGLVAGIYTQSQREANRFASLNAAGHGVINSPKGTGTPAYGMGFGGNKDSGVGEILNTADPLAAFTRPTHYSRIAQNKDIQMED